MKKFLIIFKTHKGDKKTRIVRAENLNEAVSLFEALNSGSKIVSIHALSEDFANSLGFQNWYDSFEKARVENEDLFVVGERVAISKPPKKTGLKKMTVGEFVRYVDCKRTSVVRILDPDYNYTCDFYVATDLLTKIEKEGEI